LDITVAGDGVVVEVGKKVGWAEVCGAGGV